MMIQLCVVVVMAQIKSTSPNAAERKVAMQLGRASHRVSGAGVVAGIALTILTILVHVMNKAYHEEQY